MHCVPHCVPLHLHTSTRLGWGGVSAWHGGILTWGGVCGVEFQNAKYHADDSPPAPCTLVVAMTWRHTTLSSIPIKNQYTVSTNIPTFMVQHKYPNLHGSLTGQRKGLVKCNRGWVCPYETTSMAPQTEPCHFTLSSSSIGHWYCSSQPSYRSLAFASTPTSIWLNSILAHTSSQVSDLPVPDKQKKALELY